MHLSPHDSTLFPYTTLFRSSLAALGAYGRFVEIGKRDIYQHGRLRLWQLRRNATYTVVDLAQLAVDRPAYLRSEEHTSELQSRRDLVCRLLLEKKYKSVITP